MAMVPYLRTQLEIMRQIELRLRDSANDRWTEAEIYRAINFALEDWAERVKVPFVYNIPGGWVNGTYEYELPWYMTTPLDVEYKKTIPSWLYAGDTTTFTWTDLVGWRLTPNDNGTYSIHLAWPTDSVDGRIFWWGNNSQVPTTIPALNADITSTATSLVLSTVPSPFIGQAGYIKVNSEYIQYQGLTEGTSTVTLSNLERGLNGTTATTHSSSDSVYWAIAAHRNDLYQQLSNRALGYLFSLFLADAAPRESDHMSALMQYYNGLADKFWAGYVPARSTKFRLTRKGVGDVPIGNWPVGGIQV